MSPAAAVSGSSDFLNHNRLLVSVQEDSQNRGDEEHNRVHNTKSPRSFQHLAVLTDIPCPFRAGLFAIITKWTKINVNAGCAEIRTTGVVDAPKLVDGSNKGANEAKIDEGNKEG